MTWTRDDVIVMLSHSNYFAREADISDGLFNFQCQHLPGHRPAWCSVYITRAQWYTFQRKAAQCDMWSYFYNSPPDRQWNILIWCQSYLGKHCSSHLPSPTDPLWSVRFCETPAKVGPRSGKLELTRWCNSRVIPQHCSLIIWCCWCKDRDRMKPVYMLRAYMD